MSGRRLSLHVAAVALVLALAGAAAQDAEPPQPRLRTGSTPASDYVDVPLRGFQVRLDPALAADSSRCARALDALERDLAAALDRLPDSVHAKLRTVPIFLSKRDPVTPCACYHPSARWLEEHGYDPGKARSVELANAERYLEWRSQQPSMVLHELAHAYEDYFLRDAREDLAAAHARVEKAGTYDDVLRASGARDRHYALTNRAEYFAETTEALFGVNDFWPFVRAELRIADPEGAALVETLWGR